MEIRNYLHILFVSYPDEISLLKCCLDKPLKIDLICLNNSKLRSVLTTSIDNRCLAPVKGV